MPSKQRYSFNIVLLAVVILWPLFQSEFFNGLDGKGRVKIILSVMAIVVNGKYLFQVPKVAYVWLLWIVYSIINTYINGFSMVDQQFPLWAHHHLIFPFIVMLITYQTVFYDWKRTSKALLTFFVIYFILGTIEMESIESYDVGTRSSNELGNTFLNSLFLLLTFSAIIYVTRRIRLFWLVVIGVLVSYVMLISGERKGVIALIIIIFGICIAINGARNLRAVVSYIALAIIAYASFDLLMDNTSFGLRMTESIKNTNYQNSVFLTLMGDRAIQYVEGWEFFLQHPWTGIGVRKFAEINSYWTDGGGLLHTEYMVQLAECGIIGSIMFIVFYYGMLKRLFHHVQNKEHKKVLMILRATFVAIIVLNFVAWTYDNVNYFMIYGFIYAFCEMERRCFSDKKN